MRTTPFLPFYELAGPECVIKSACGQRPRTLLFSIPCIIEVIECPQVGISPKVGAEEIGIFISFPINLPDSLLTGSDCVLKNKPLEKSCGLIFGTTAAVGIIFNLPFQLERIAGGLKATNGRSRKYATT